MRIQIGDENKIIESYKEGHSMAEIGKQFGVTAATIWRILKKHNVETRTNGGIYKLNEVQICKDYKSGKSSSVIAEENNVTIHTITNILEKHLIDRDNIYHNLNLVGDYWENIDSYDKAYFLGLLISDGNVIGNCTRLQLSNKDSYILEEFAKCTKNENKFNVDKRGLVGLAVKRKKWVTDLAKYGVVPNKTSKVYLPKLDAEMMPHLIRGLIDGDGWVSYKGHQIGFCGNENIVTQVRDFLSDTLKVYRIKVIHSDENLWMIAWSSTKDIQTIGNYIYKDKESCFLKRKYNNFLNIINANTEVISEIAKGSETP